VRAINKQHAANRSSESASLPLRGVAPVNVTT
jgi:hypothetical protein